MGLFEDFYSDLFDGHQSQESKECQAEYAIGQEEGRAGEGDLEVFGDEAFGWMDLGTKQHQSRIAGIRQGHQDSAGGEADECESSEADSDDDECYAAEDEGTDEGDDADEDAEHGYCPHHSPGEPVPTSPRPPMPPGSGDGGVRTTISRRVLVYSGGVLLAEKKYDEDDPSFSCEQCQLEFLLGALLGNQEVDEDEYDEEEEEPEGDDCEEEPEGDDCEED